MKIRRDIVKFWEGIKLSDFYGRRFGFPKKIGEDTQRDRDRSCELSREGTREKKMKKSELTSGTQLP